MPTLSVVIPAYDAEDTVAAAARSASTQEGIDVEVIVVDDGSHDDTAAVAAAVPGVEVVRQGNAGPAAARNNGIRCASGEYVGFLDADDRLLPGWAAVVTSLLAGGAAIAVTDTLITDAATGATLARYSQEVAFPAPAEQRSRILVENFVQSTACIPRGIAIDSGGFDETLRGAADWDLWIRIILGGGAAVRDLNALSIYTRGHASMSSNRVAMTQEELVVLRKHAAATALDDTQRRALRESLRLRNGRLALALGDAESADGRRSGALRYMQAAARLHQPRLIVRSLITAAAPRLAVTHGSRARSR